MGLKFLLCAFVLGSIASVAVSQELPTFTFFFTEDTDVKTSPLYLVTRDTLKEETSFDGHVICSSGAWFACFDAGSRCMTHFYKENKCLKAYTTFFKYAILFGNSSDMSQNSFTFFTGELLDGNVSETYFEDVPRFYGDVNSLILTGVESETTLTLFTQQQYAGAEYCVKFVDDVTSPERAATSLVNMPIYTGLPPDAFRSFKFGTSCSKRAKRIVP